MKIMAITRRLPGATTERIQSLQVPEARMVWTMIGNGFIRQIHFDPERPCVILILECANREDAIRRLAELPMVKEKQIEFDYYTLGPYRQLEHLFAQS